MHASLLLPAGVILHELGEESSGKGRERGRNDRVLVLVHLPTVDRLGPRFPIC